VPAFVFEFVNYEGVLTGDAYIGIGSIHDSESLEVDALDPESVDDEGEQVDSHKADHQAEHEAPHQEPHLTRTTLVLIHKQNCESALHFRTRIFEYSYAEISSSMNIFPCV
jgi:hypothetical protein